MPVSPQALFAIWAKSDRTSGNSHPLLLHCLDSAAVARELWRVFSPETRQVIGNSLGLGPNHAESWAVFLVSVHDLGKASPVFQRKWSASIGKLVEAGYSFPEVAEDVPHGRITAQTLPKLLVEQFGIPRPIAISLGRMTGGHHGIFDSPGVLGVSNRISFGDGLWASVRGELVLKLSGLLGVTSAPTGRRMAGYALLAALTTIADWIASAEEHFPYVGGTMGDFDENAYFQASIDKARAAIERLGWVADLQMPHPLSFQKMFEVPSVRPLQEKCIELAETLSHPSLTIIEAPMGEGKTEAALYLAERLRQRFHLRGTYFGLPTQATSNQMFGRVEKALTSGAAEGVAHLMLLHGHSAISSEFEVLKRRGWTAFEVTGIEETNEGMAVAAAGEWFTHKKRGLLAPYGVGTVDQALMAALQSKHVFVRLLGLSGKVVVIDEVHAYDTYMTSLLERTIEWLKAIGSSIIMLSATLTATRREKFLKVMSGQDCRLAGEYPQVSFADAAQTGTIPFESAQVNRVVKLERIGEDVEEVAEWACSQVSDGGNAAIICNTVDKAQKVYQACRRRMPGVCQDGDPEVDLFHSRFPFEDRDEREKRSLRRYGKGDSVDRPKRSVLVATQVIEQSLDLDFDFMASELAPVDLLFQRMGRLHRHKRQGRPGGDQPVFTLLETPVGDNGQPDLPRGHQYVYESHLLFRTWFVLKTRAAFLIPTDIRTLVDEVYREEWLACSDAVFEEMLLTSAEKMRANRAKEHDEAIRRGLPDPQATCQLELLTSMGREDDEDLHPVFRALTRLADESVSAVCLYERGGELFIDPGGKRPALTNAKPTMEQTIDLLLRSCTVSDKRVVFGLMDAKVPSGWKKSPLLRNSRMLSFPETGRHELGRYSIVLDEELGLRVEDSLQ